jgi:hypothetical protein
MGFVFMGWDAVQAFQSGVPCTSQNGSTVEVCCLCYGLIALFFIIVDRGTPILLVLTSVDVRSRGGPERTSECCVSLTWMVMQGEYTGIYPGWGKEGPTSSEEGESLYFLAPKCLRRGYKL